jgi:hypothetical protein
MSDWSLGLRAACTQERNAGPRYPPLAWHVQVRNLEHPWAAVASVLPTAAQQPLEGLLRLRQDVPHAAA